MMYPDLVGRGAPLDNLPQVLWADRRDLMSRLYDYRIDKSKWDHLIADGMVTQKEKGRDWAYNRVKGDLTYTSMCVSRNAWKYANDLEREYMAQIPPLPATIKHYRKLARVYWHIAAQLMFGDDVLISYEDAMHERF